MAFPNPRDAFMPSSQPQQSSQFLHDSHLPYFPHRAQPPPPDVNAHHVHRPSSAVQRIPPLSRFPHPHPHMPPPPPPPPPHPPTHIHQLNASAPISCPQPGAPSQPQPPRYMFPTAVPVADSSSRHVQSTTTSRSVPPSHVPAYGPSYAPPCPAPFAPKIPLRQPPHMPFAHPQMMAPPPPDAHAALHAHVAPSRPLAPPSPLPAKPAMPPHHRLPPPPPPQAAHAPCVGARPLQQSPPPGQRSFVGPLSKEQFVDNAAADLDYTASANDGTFPLPLYSEPESVFFSVVKPEIPTREYIKRLVTYTHCSPSAFILMLVYLDRVARSNKKLVVTPYNMHRLLITALTLACKNLDDQCFANAHYAKVGGIPTVREMNRLELQFLKYLKYHLFVKREEHEAKIRQLSAGPNSPTSLDEQSFSPPPGPCKMGFDRKANIATRAYARVVPVRTRRSSETEGNSFGCQHVSKRSDGAVAQDASSATEMFEKGMVNGMAPVSHNGGVQRGAVGCASSRRCRNVGVEAMEVCRSCAPLEASYVTSTSTTSGCRP